jgi:hypothetical protein
MSAAPKGRAPAAGPSSGGPPLLDDGTEEELLRAARDEEEDVEYEYDAHADIDDNAPGACSKAFGRLPNWAKFSVVLLCVGGLIGAFLGLLLGDTSGGPNPPSRRMQRPVVISTWFTTSVDAGWMWANHSFAALDIVENGCQACEDARCDGTVGWGGSPDTTGETTLDALIVRKRSSTPSPSTTRACPNICACSPDRLPA